MIFAAFTTPQADLIPALVKNGRVYPLPFPDMLEVIQVGAEEAAHHASEASFELDEVRLLAPLQPTSLRDAYAFEQHVRTASQNRGREVPEGWYKFPVFYYTNPHSIFGPEDVIPYPHYTQALDYELEIAVVIGRPGINIKPENANEHIFGYTIFNDWSARDVQRAEMKVGLGPAKGKDFASSLGPVIVTHEALADRTVNRPGVYDLMMSAKVNGVEMSRGNFKDIFWSFGEIIARASDTCELQAGDVIGSGTVGTGCLLELTKAQGPWLNPGDEVELEIERIGILKNMSEGSTNEKKIFWMGGNTTFDIGLWIIHSCHASPARVETIVAETFQALTSVAPATQTPPNGTVISVNNISFVIPTGLASGAQAETIEAVPPSNDAPWWEIAPTYNKYLLQNYLLPETFHEPVVYVYPVDEYIQVNADVAGLVDVLKTIINSQGQSLPENLPFLPAFNAGQVFHSNEQILTFQNGTGVRYLTQYAQAPYPVNNYSLFYTFQGLTGDGAYYVSAILPINAAFLSADGEPDTALPPDGVPFDWNNFENVPAHFELVKQKLNVTDPNAFMPSLTALDALMQSVLITGTP